MHGQPNWDEYLDELFETRFGEGACPHGEPEEAYCDACEVEFRDSTAHDGRGGDAK